MIRENVALAFSSLLSNKMRALLTMLGIIIGIMAIIAIVVIGDAMTESVTGSMATLGINNIYVAVQERSIVETAFGLPDLYSGAKVPDTEDLISDEMIADLRENFPNDIDGIALNHSLGGATARDGDLYANVSIMGVNADFTRADNITMLSGSFITESDVEAFSQSAVVSDKFVQNMFPDGRNPIGELIYVYDPHKIELYTIIGVYRYEPMGFVSIVSDEELVTTLYIPVTTAKQDLIEKNYVYITVIGTADSDVVVLTERIQHYFDGVYAANDTWRASASNLTSMLDAITEALATMSLAIAFIAGISLLVGGIGVMNIMLVSVTERTREIGIRKALGAKNFHIRFQFVTEAIIISSVGGIIGLLCGIGVGSAISTLFSVNPVISPTAAMGSVLFSMVIGIFFGLYPANKAAKLDPIEALRYE